MKAALVVRFTNPVPGRERAALAYGREVDEFTRKNAAKGISEPKWYWSSSGENMIIVEGEYEKLLELTSTPEAMKLENKGMILMQDFRDELVAVGRDEAEGLYEQALTELGIK
jgi:hypothetical protein